MSIYTFNAAAQILHRIQTVNLPLTSSSLLVFKTEELQNLAANAHAQNSLRIDMNPDHFKLFYKW